MTYSRERLYVFLIHMFAKLTIISANCYTYIPTSVSELLMDQSVLFNKTSYCTFVLLDDHRVSIYSTASWYVNRYPDSIHIFLLDHFVTKQIAYTQVVDRNNVVEISANGCLMTDYTSYSMQTCDDTCNVVLRSLTRFFNSEHAAIISTADKQHRDMAIDMLKHIQTDILQNRYINGIRSVIHYETPEEMLSKNLSAIMQNIKLQDISLVILFASTDVTSLLFEIARRYELAGFYTVWLTMELAHHLIHAEQIPWQILDVRHGDDIPWRKDDLHKVISAISEVCNKTWVNTSSSKDRLQMLKMNLKERLRSVHCSTNDRQINVYARNSSSTKCLKWTQIFTSSTGNDLYVVSDASLLMRIIRTSSRLTELKVVTIIDAPFTMYANHLYNNHKKTCDHGVLCKRAVIGLPDTHPNKWEHTCCIGMAIDLLLLVSNDLYFYPNVYVVEDGFYGGKNKKTNEWNGLIRDIQQGKADIAAAALTLTSDRQEVVDFCEPYMRIDLGVMISTLSSKLEFINWEFLGPLAGDLQVWILVTFIIGTILIYLLENQHLALQRILDKGVHPRYSWREGFSYFSGLTFQRDLGGKNPKRAGARVTAIAFAFGMVIIMTTYTAVLTASKVSQETTNPFFGFKDDRIRYPTDDFKYGTVTHTSIEAYFQKSDDHIHQKMFHFMKNYNVNHTLDGIELVKSGRLQAFIYETPILMYHISKERGCTLKIYGDPIPQGGYAFSVPKKSPWKQLISQSILKFKESEKINAIHKRWFPASCGKNNTSTQEKVEINYFGGLIFILCLAMVISFALLGLEYFCYRHHRLLINPIQDKVLVWRESKAACRRNALINPEDISRLQRIQARKGSDNGDKSDSEGSVITEGEEEIIRMRMRGSHYQSQLKHPSGTDTTSVNTTISEGSANMSSFFYNTFDRCKSLENIHWSGNANTRSARGSKLMTTMEVSENETLDPYHKDDNIINNQPLQEHIRPYYDSDVTKSDDKREKDTEIDKYVNVFDENFGSPAAGDLSSKRLEICDVSDDITDRYKNKRRKGVEVIDVIDENCLPVFLDLAEMNCEDTSQNTSQSQTKTTDYESDEQRLSVVHERNQFLDQENKVQRHHQRNGFIKNNKQTPDLAEHRRTEHNLSNGFSTNIHIEQRLDIAYDEEVV